MITAIAACGGVWMPVSIFGISIASSQLDTGPLISTPPSSTPRMIEPTVVPSIQPLAMTSSRAGSNSVRMPYFAGEYAAAPCAPGLDGPAAVAGGVGCAYICIIINVAGACGSRLIPRFIAPDQTARAGSISSRARVPAASMSRPLIAQVNLSALRANLAKARERAPGAQVLAVVKANAYGHGLRRVLPALGEADGLALVEIEAAITLRERHYAR